MLTDQLPQDWRLLTLGEVADPNGRAIVSGPFGSNIGSRFFVSEGVPVIRGNNLTTDATRFIDSGFVFVTEDKARELGNVDAIEGDLIFTAAGTLGQVGLIPAHSQFPKYVISNKQIRARLDSTVIDSLFAFYWFSSNYMTSYISKRNTGSSVPLINLSVVRSLPVPLPPLSEQRRIVGILGALDDKIELNRRMSQTLEEIARVLFKSWFVDFDPVHAKAAGREPVGMDAETAALFPSEFEESELGLIPKGWKPESFANTVSIIGGGTPRTSEASYWGRDIPWFSMADIPGPGEVFVIDTEKKITSHGLQNSSTRLLTQGTTILTARGTVGKLALVGHPMAMNQSCYGLESRNGCQYFTYFRTLQLVDALRQRTHGSVFDTITRSTLEGLWVASPGKPLEIRFDSIVGPLLERIRSGLSESRTLAAIRDAALPRLMSGEIRILKEITE